MLKSVLEFYKKSDEMIEKGIDISEIKASPMYQELVRMKTRYTENDLDALSELPKKIDEAMVVGAF